MNEPTRFNIPEWTVSELSAALKRTVEDAFGYVRVRGEISGYRGPQASGHCYFALKDEGAKIEAVIWRTAFARMRLKPEEGLEVFVTGRLTTYPGRSKYQIVIETLEPAGLGALIFQREINVAGRVRALVAGDFAAHAHVAIGVLDGAFESGRQFGDGEFGDVGLRVGHELNLAYCDVTRRRSGRAASGRECRNP